jgi:hypothetical protein
LAALKEVLLTDIRARPVDLVTAKAMASESTRTKVYLLDKESCPIRQGTFVTRYKT